MEGSGRVQIKETHFEGVVVFSSIIVFWWILLVQNLQSDMYLLACICRLSETLLGCCNVTPILSNMLTIQSNVPAVLFLWVYKRNKGFQYKKAGSLIYMVPWMNLGNSFMYMFWKPLMDIYVSYVSQTKLGRHLLLGEESLHQRAVICYV